MKAESLQLLQLLFTDTPIASSLLIRELFLRLNS